MGPFLVHGSSSKPLLLHELLRRIAPRADNPLAVVGQLLEGLAPALAETLDEVA